MGQQAGGALKIVIRFFGDYLLQVRHGSDKVVHLESANSATVKRIGSIGSRSDGAVESFPGLRDPAVVHIQVAQFFEISRRWVVANHRFELMNPLAARKHFEGLP